MIKKAVCLISGGLDSCITATIAKDQGYEIYALTFDYGQKHRKEINCARKIAKDLDAKKHVIFKLDLSQFKGSSLTDKNLKIQKDKKINEIGLDIPLTYVPARNTIFLSIGLAYAEVNKCDAIFIGVTSADYSGYPDCRPEYIESFEKMMNLATKTGVQGNKIKLITPLINMKKSEIIQKGSLLNAPLEKTWSCYEGKDKACGRCDSCLLRLKGFKEAGIVDPIKYNTLPDWVD